jgi:hypothetical protein
MTTVIDEETAEQKGVCTSSALIGEGVPIQNSELRIWNLEFGIKGRPHEFQIPNSKFRIRFLRGRSLVERSVSSAESGKMLYPFFEWCEATTVGHAIRSSLWAFAVIESVHLLALAAIGGAVLVVDLRLLGLGLRRQPIPELARNAYPWFVGSLIVMLVTGVALFLSEAVKCYYSTAFWVKMSSLALAMIFSFTVRRRVTLADEARVRPIWYKAVALVSLSLWFGVGAGGRWIGFSG